MRYPVLCFALLVLVGPARAADDSALWEAVFQLDDPEHAKKAASLLRSNGAAGYDVLSKAARMGGERAALAIAATELKCQMMMMRALPYHPYGMRGQELPQSAAKLAMEILLEDKALREGMLGAKKPFDRAMALLASAGVPGALPGALKRLEKEKAPRVLEWVESTSHCAKFRTGDQVDEEAGRLARRLEGTVQQPRCEDAGMVASTLVEGMAKGSYQVSGWARSNDDFTVTVMRGAEERSHLAPPCALALYDALAKRGTYLHGLVVPITQQRLLPLSTRDAAARRAVRDLTRYPEQERNKLAAELVNAGYEVPVKVTFREGDTFAQEKELEAAARQGSKVARAQIESYVFCRGTFGSQGLAMLGYLETREVADMAYELAVRCPHALGSGTAALVRLKDPRGLELLGKALENLGFAEDDLQRAAIEAYTPALGSELRRQVSQGSSRAKDLLKILTLAGVMRD
ncbi:hypothetical protein [Hyalangium sp.]|uniref:hypothetical protein n=1 Tax=Hyalangium sp. TaxID=2028555 RepID=UPI002D52503F|nr:hypothetical protein [Hyalangium sp.]HYH95788.1 hypothetical protein [Hyalangium sp.]